MDTAISSLNSFFQSHFDALDVVETELWEFFASRVEPIVVPSANELDAAQLTFLLRAFSEIEQDLKELHWFEYVNTEAVSRIISKLERYGQAGSPLHLRFQAQWQKSQRTWEMRLLALLDRIGRLLNEDIQDSLKSSGSPTDRHHFLAHAFNQESCPQIPDDAAREAAQTGNLGPIIQYMEFANTESSIMESGYSSLIRSLLRFSVVSSPAQHEALLRFIPPSQRALLQWRLCKWYIVTIGHTQKLNVSSEMASARPLSAVQEITLPGAMEADVLRVPRALLTKDRLGRLLLHYAAGHGLLPICQGIVATLGDAGPGATVRAISSTDYEGHTPLHLAVIKDHTSVVTLLINVITTQSVFVDSEEIVKDTIRDVLHISLRRENDEIVHYLLRGLADPRRQSTRGENALHIAAQLRRADYVDLVVRAMSGKRAGLDAQDHSRGWTPLFFACANGDYDSVELLLKAGTSQEIADHLGWTAKEHAAFRGYLAVAGLFEASEVRNVKGGPADIRVSKAPYASIRRQEGEKIIIASLGTTRTDRVVTGLRYTSCSSTPGTYESLWFALEISAPGSTSRPPRVRLPILEDQINDSFIFTIPESCEPRLVFKIIRLPPKCDGGAVVGSGAALLEANTHQFGAKRQSLIRDQTISILDRNTMDVAGTVTFTSLVVKPYRHLQTCQPSRTTRDALGQPILVGHRGAGMNTNTREYLQLGENTIGSFLSAEKLGASFVEFDVQVTRDLEAVAFHDFSLSETGTDVPVHDLTLEQFLHASKIQSPHGNPLSVLGTAPSRTEPGRSRSRSVGHQFEAGAIQIRDRMKHTIDFRSKGFKPNTRGDFIQDSFATLKDILVELPPDVGCDVEISSCPQIP